MRPDEKRLEALIGAAFDRLPEPGAARLEALEARLLSRAARRSGPRTLAPLFWWLLLGLAATGAAAWWGGEYLSRNPAQPPAEQRITPVDPPATETRTDKPGEADVRGEAAKPAVPTDRQREIYRRERY